MPVAPWPFSATVFGGSSRSWFPPFSFLLSRDPGCGNSYCGRGVVAGLGFKPSRVDHDLDCVRHSIVGDQQLDPECLGLVPFYSLMDSGAVDPVTP